ncbi:MULTISPECIES: hypothetical protein [unclassified Streptomyces]|uniref:hypothetical protein n=1 Tax=unclassified Streptomyces TaxID=2593676 RepID=UPI00225214C0|nr:MULTISPECIES: hypothetical protein [unclassified Streptomyces]MCX4882580.1 hypothetical protein [Streptomyces sp. NBC_00847]MCX5422608.1 hypothetical protein [Streptomyces sp. NBC_00078]
MSEYQYYEFQAIDRSLTKDELEQVRALSSRARISATHFVNEYHYGNFRGDERRLMEQLYDAHLYFANWGSRRLMLRLPTALLSARSAEPYCAEDALTCWTRNGHLLLDFAYSAEDGGEWDFENSFTLASFTTLRTELAAGDLRPLYIAWLSALTRWELEEDVDEDEYTSTIEPPVPAGLAQLTGPQQALADFLRVDPHLLTAAARASSAAPSQTIDKDALAGWIRALPQREKDALLLEAVLGTAPQPGPVLLARHRAASHSAAEPSTATRRRSAAELLDAAHEVRTEHTRQQEQARAQARAQARRAEHLARESHLDRLAENAEQAWQDVANLIGKKQAGPYDTAVTLLKDLREVHDRAGTPEEFTRRLDNLREQHRGKPSLMRRLTDADLTPR